jgi:hypothetical protein
MILEKKVIYVASKKTTVFPGQLEVTDMLSREILENVLTNLTVVSLKEEQGSYLDRLLQKHIAPFLV